MSKAEQVPTPEDKRATAALDGQQTQSLISEEHADLAADGENLGSSLLWLIKLRWVAILGLSLAIVAGGLTGWVRHIEAPMLVVVALAIVNTWLALGPGVVEGKSRSRKADIRALVVQLHIDIVALTFLLHWSGGIENPFGLFYLFPVALASTLLPSRLAVLTALSAFLCFAGLIVCENMALLPHRPLPGLLGPEAPLYANPVFITALLIAVGTALIGIVYFIQSVVRRERRAEQRRRRHEAVAVSRERLARIGQISAGLAHSIRNPLHGILNCLELVRGRVDDATATETLGLMSEGLHRIENVTERLLVLTREAPLQRAMSDPNEVVAEALRLIDAKLNGTGIKLEQNLESVPKIWLDPNRIHEALFNILDNAIDAHAGMERGVVSVSTAVVKQPVRGVRIAVRDQGTGMDPVLAQRVYDPFFTTKAVGEGSGLGLAIAKRVVEAHGGEIEIASRSGEGTRVSILLPSDSPESPTGASS